MLAFRKIEIASYVELIAVCLQWIEVILAFFQPHCLIFFRSCNRVCVNRGTKTIIVQKFAIRFSVIENFSEIIIS